MLPPVLADCYWRARLPFSVNILAEEAVLAALDDAAFREATLEAVRRGRRELSEGFRALGCQVWPSRANFVMLRPPSSCPAKTLYLELLKKGLIVRSLASYELPELLRVSVGNAAENRLLLEAMGEILGRA